MANNKYKVQDNGKAPSGLSVGSEVVTGGGTYKITGVNADGSYQSSKVSDTNTGNYTGGYASVPGGTSKVTTPAPTIPTNFKGSATGVNVYSNDQDAVRKQMNENSKNWWTADDAGKAALHAENEQLAAILGDDVTFGAGGVWSGNAKTPFTSLPEYDSKHSSQVDALLDIILNRKPFEYDYKTDPTYLAYEDKYRRLGDRAREDTLGNVASLNGGYASSWATSAASQAQNDYNQQLSDIIPVLYDAAYNRYLTEDQLMRSDLGLLMGVDNMHYGRYRDTVGDAQWLTDFNYGVYKDTVDNEHWNKDFDHKVSQDALAQDNWERSFALETKQVEWNMSNTEAMQEYDRLVTKWQLTGIADEEVAAKFGIPVGTTTESYYFNKASQELQQEKFDLDKANSSKTGGGGDGGGFTDQEKTLVIKEATAAQSGLGRGYAANAAAAKSVLANAGVYGYGMDEYFAICKEMGIPDSIAEQAYIDYKNEYIAAESEGSGEKDYLYYAGIMGQQEDPEAWLAQNKYNIPADIVKQLSELLNY